jgi:hypothetical protein
VRFLKGVVESYIDAGAKRVLARSATVKCGPSLPCPSPDFAFEIALTGSPADTQLSTIAMSPTS